MHIQDEVILIASILKPVDDPRMLSKLAYSLTKDNKRKVIICGAKGSTNFSSEKNIVLFPVTHQKRNWFYRLHSSLKITIKVLTKKPKVVILNSPDLLLFIAPIKIFIRFKLLYDVRENYVRNILYTNTYFGVKATVAKSLISIIENIGSKVAIDGFILAERCYIDELRFISKPIIVLENKYPPINDKPNPTPTPKQYFKSETAFKLIYTGTLAEAYGIFDVINWVKMLNNAQINVELTIIGYAAQKHIRDEIIKQTQNNNYINTFGLHKPVAHTDIKDAIKQAEIGLVSYKDNKSYRNRVPTKLFEYASNNLAIISTPNVMWHNRFAKLTNYLEVDFAKHYQDAVVALFLANAKAAKNSLLNRCGAGVKNNCAIWGVTETRKLNTYLDRLIYKKNRSN